MLTRAPLPRSPHSQGFTLVELLVAVAAMGVVVFYTLGTFTVQHQTYVVVDQVAETQQNGRAIASLIERDVRNAGYMVPSEAAICGVDSVGGPDVLVASDASAILPVDDLPVALAGQDLGSEVVGAPAINSGSTVTLNIDSHIIDGTASYDTDGNGTLDSDFQPNGGAIVVDITNPGRGVACGIVDSLPSATSIRIDLLAGLSSTVPLPADLRVVPAHIYQLANPAGGPIEIRRNGTTLAKDVEDMQVAWFYDDDGDGQVDDPGETRGVTGNNYDTTVIDGSDLREVRINVVVRTRSEDPRERGDFSQGQILENRAGGTVAAADERRRRTHTATVRVRNLVL